MRRRLWWGKGLFTLLLFTIFAAWGCVSPEPVEEEEGLEVTEDAEPMEEGASVEEEELGLDKGAEEGQTQDQLLDIVEEIGQNETGDQEAETPTPSAPAPIPTEEVFVGGKAGVGMATGLPEEGSKMAYIVQKGDTLSRIAKRIFNDVGRWKELADLSQFKNPNRIFPGDIVYYQLNSQSLAFAKKYENMQRNLTEVKEGEGLADISKRLYGNTESWKLLWRHNDNIGNPSELIVGSHVFYVVSSELYSNVVVDSKRESNVKLVSFHIYQKKKIG